MRPRDAPGRLPALRVQMPQVSSRVGLILSQDGLLSWLLIYNFIVNPLLTALLTQKHQQEFHHESHSADHRFRFCSKHEPRQLSGLNLGGACEFYGLVLWRQMRESSETRLMRPYEWMNGVKGLTAGCFGWLSWYACFEHLEWCRGTLINILYKAFVFKINMTPTCANKVQNMANPDDY